jgi:hypothetical protein
MAVVRRTAVLAVALLLLHSASLARVVLLPDPKVSDHVWSWTVQCPFDPAAG